jgi:hypothetical protein
MSTRYHSIREKLPNTLRYTFHPPFGNRLVAVSLLALSRNSTGEYVSGMVNVPRIVSIPESIALVPQTHRHPAASPRKPPTIGPRVGPVKGAKYEVYHFNLFFLFGTLENWFE